MKFVTPPQSAAAPVRSAVVDGVDNQVKARSQGGQRGRQPRIVRRVVRLGNPCGLHLRVCSALVTAAERFRARVTIQKDDRVEDACSILGLMTLGATRGQRLLLAATGPDADDAMDAFAELLASQPD